MEHQKGRPRTSAKRRPPMQAEKPVGRRFFRGEGVPKELPDSTKSQRREEKRPPCPHYPACYSCPLLQFPYLQQLEKKREFVVKALSTYPALSSIRVPPVVPSARQFGYRTRVKLVVRRVEGKTLIGMYIPDTHKVADISSCPVHPEPVNRLVQFLKEAIQQLKIIPYDEEHDTGQLRYIDIRYSFWQQQATLTLVTRHMDFPQVRELIREIERRFPFVSGIVQNINDRPGNVIWGERFRPLRGRDSLLEKLGHFKLAIPVSAFSQVNPQVARKIYETVLSWARFTGEEIALDLYCGIGPISLFLASQAKLVIGIDENEEAVNTAKQNARRNGYNNCRFFAGDAAEKLQEVTITLPPISVVVVNPPRKGLSPEAFAAVVAVKAPRLFYISCDPQTLARDLDRFAREQYTVRNLQSFDMFPQTEQVETAVYLEYKPESHVFMA